MSWLALPLGLVTLLGSLNVNVPRYFIESYVGQKELGVFAAFAGLLGAVYFVQVAIGQAALPRLAQYHASGMAKRYLHLSTFVLGMALASGMAGVALAFFGGAGLLRIVYSDEFAQHAELFRWLSIALVGQGACSHLELPPERRAPLPPGGGGDPGRHAGHRASLRLAGPPLRGLRRRSAPHSAGPAPLASCRSRCS